LEGTTKTGRGQALKQGPLLVSSLEFAQRIYSLGENKNCRRDLIYTHHSLAIACKKSFLRWKVDTQVSTEVWGGGAAAESHGVSFAWSGLQAGLSVDWSHLALAF
jgi:hypothetical protein